MFGIQVEIESDGGVAKNAPLARFLYAPRPVGFESLLLRRICL